MGFCPHQGLQHKDAEPLDELGLGGPSQVQGRLWVEVYIGDLLIYLEYSISSMVEVYTGDLLIYLEYYISSIVEVYIKVIYF